MNNLRDRLLTADQLPFEVVSRIIKIFASRLLSYPYADRDTSADLYLHSRSITELLRLRLVSKTWSKATVPIAFYSFHVHNSRMAEVIIDDWSTLTYPHDRPCPVKRLIIEDVLYMKPDHEESLRKDAKKRSPIFMEQAAKLIESIGENLIDLTLVFSSSFGISPSLVKAIGNIKHLKKLNVEDGFKGSAYPGAWDPDSFANLLVAIPNLESLTIERTVLKRLQLKPPALSNLRYFNFRYREVNFDAIAHILETAKESLKVIEYTSHCEELEEGKRVFGPIKNTLEGLVTFLVNKDIPEEVINMKFPKLRFLRSRQSPYFDEEEIPAFFLTWPIFHSIRTLALDFAYGPSYLEFHMENSGEDPFHTMPNLKHIIFIMRWDEDGTAELDPDLVEDLEDYGIECHVMPESRPDVLMDLDLKLNGPMN